MFFCADILEDWKRKRPGKRAGFFLPSMPSSSSLFGVTQRWVCSAPRHILFLSHQVPCQWASVLFCVRFTRNKAAFSCPKLSVHSEARGGSSPVAHHRWEQPNSALRSLCAALLPSLHPGMYNLHGLGESAEVSPKARSGRNGILH